MQDPVLTPIFVAALTAAATAAEVTVSASVIATTASILSTATLIAGSVALQYALRPSVPKPEDGQITLNQATPARIAGCGRNRLAGAYMAYENADDGRSVDVIAFHNGRVQEFIQYYLHDDPVVLVDGIVQQILPDERYGSNAIRIETNLGLESQPVLSVANELMPTVWTTDHKLNGTAAGVLACRGVVDAHVPKIYPNGPPRMSAVIDCGPYFDWRDPAQTFANPLSWRTSYNPVVNLVGFLCDSDNGMGMDFERRALPVLAALTVQADICDEAITLKAGGTEPRYKCSTWWNLDTDPAVTVADFLASCDGWVDLDGDGTLVIKVGKYQPPTVTIDDDSITGFSIDYGVADEDAVDELAISFTSPIHDYRTMPGEPWRNEAAITRRGQTRTQPFNPKGVQSHAQLRRLAKRNVARLNAPVRGSCTTTMDGLRVQGHRFITLQRRFIPELATGAVVEIRKFRRDFSSRQCSFEWVIVDPATIDAWDAATEEGEGPPTPDKLLVAPLPVPQNVEVDPAGDASTGQYLISFDDLERTDLTYRVQWRLTDDGTGSPGIWSSLPVAEFETAAGRTSFPFPIPVIADAEYEIQVAVVGPRRTQGDWSGSTFIVATTEVRLLEDGTMRLLEDGSPRLLETA